MPSTSPSRKERTVAERLLKGEEVADILYVSRSMAYLLMRRGDLPSLRIGNAVRVRPEDLEAYIEQQRALRRKP